MPRGRLGGRKLFLTVHSDTSREMGSSYRRRHRHYEILFAYDEHLMKYDLMRYETVLQPLATYRQIVH